MWWIRHYECETVVMGDRNPWLQVVTDDMFFRLRRLPRVGESTDSGRSDIHSPYGFANNSLRFAEASIRLEELRH